MKIAIIGAARHGKDTVAEMLKDIHGLSHQSSSKAALEIFLFDVLRDEYGLTYNSIDEAFEDRVNHRSVWFEEIAAYNTPDKTKLGRQILSQYDIYVGIRSKEELYALEEKNMFDLIIGVFDPRKERESKASSTINVFEDADIIIVNDKSKEALREKVMKIKINNNVTGK